VSEKFKVGQQVFIICFCGSERKKQGIVTKIGNKYIYVDMWMGGDYNYEVIFNKETRLEKKTDMQAIINCITTSRNIKMRLILAR
jgi:hypothetical protein